MIQFSSTGPSKEIFEAPGPKHFKKDEVLRLLPAARLKGGECFFLRKEIHH